MNKSDTKKIEISKRRDKNLKDKLKKKNRQKKTLILETGRPNCLDSNY